MSFSVTLKLLGEATKGDAEWMLRMSQERGSDPDLLMQAAKTFEANLESTRVLLTRLIQEKEVADANFPYTYLKPSDLKVLCPNCHAHTSSDCLVSVRDGYGMKVTKCLHCHESYEYKEAK